MAQINVLSQSTIEKIAAGEVIERPLNVVKELTENAIDAGATAISVDIKDGGLSMIRVTDNGSGIEKSQIKKAFLPHATSKILDAKDLFNISSLGFRGEALSSIAAVSNVEVISKTANDFMGFRYVIEDSKEISLEDIGAPDGTTFIVRDLFFNVPARKKFLKSNQTESSYVYDLMEHIALSHPEISVKYSQNQKTLFQTSGNGSLKEVIYRIYGKDVSSKMIEVNAEFSSFSVYGFLGKPELNRSSKAFETFIINGRFTRCDVLTKALTEGYKEFLMQHKFPFCVLMINVPYECIDVNVHPSKMEVRLDNAEDIFNDLSSFVFKELKNSSLIPEESVNNEKIVIKPAIIEKAHSFEPFESKRIEKENVSLRIDEVSKPKTIDIEGLKKEIVSFVSEDEMKDFDIPEKKETKIEYVQENLFDNGFLDKREDEYEIIGQLFNTYWLISTGEKLFIMDQHAAHEKVNYERLIKQYHEKNVSSQNLNPPAVLELTPNEMNVLETYREYFNSLGFEIEEFGPGGIALRAVPTDLYGHNEYDFFKEVIDEIMDNPLRGNLDVVTEKIASMSCKASVKGNMRMSVPEVKELIKELMKLDNPYNCPHGRPTLISMSKTEIEKKFKRITD